MRACYQSEDTIRGQRVESVCKKLTLNKKLK
jgi:hypothetical protein